MSNLCDIYFKVFLFSVVSNSLQHPSSVPTVKRLLVLLIILCKIDTSLQDVIGDNSVIDLFRFYLYDGIQSPKISCHSLADYHSIGQNVEELTIASNSCNDEHFTLFCLTNKDRLKKIIVGDNCLKHVVFTELSSLRALEEFIVGSHSFTNFDDLDYVLNNQGLCVNTFRLHNCDKLKSIRIGEFSFGSCQSAIFQSRFS